MHTDRWLDLLFGKGDDEFPFWLLTVRVNILVVVLCTALISASNLSPARLRRLASAKADVCTAVILTALAAGLRFLVASANIMDYGGIAYSRLLLGYKGYFGTAQAFSLLYTLSARDIEHAIFFDRIAGTLTVPLVYLLCRRLQPNDKVFPAVAAFLFAVYPLHILFSASDALSVFSVFLAATSYVILAGADTHQQHPFMHGVAYLGGFAGLALLTQIRYENALLLIPPALVLCARGGWRQRRRLALPVVVAVAFVSIYVGAAAISGLSYQDPGHSWSNLDLITWHLALNPFMAIPVLFLGTIAVGVYKGVRLGVLALLPWVGMFTICILTSGDGHGAARIYANWLILILPLAAFGFTLMLGAPQRAAQALAGVALLCLGLMPVLLRDRLAARYIEIVENDRFKALLATLPSSVTAIVVPDDELLWRRSHSTLEVYQKYAMILAGSPDAAQRLHLVKLTDYLEHPQETDCRPGACVFFFGPPCTEENRYRFVGAQCQELLRRHPTSVLTETTDIAAPFVNCSIYTGTLRAQLCDPAMKSQRFTIYRIDG